MNHNHKTNALWLNTPDRRARLQEYLSRNRLTTFGYTSVPEEAKVSKVQHHFDSVAHCYDFMNTLLSVGIHYLWKRQAMNALQPGRGQRVLDVCGGTGDLSVLASQKVGPGGQVVLYDINLKMMQAGASMRRRQTPGAPITCVQGNAEQITFPEASFDAVTVGFGIRNVTHMEKAFQEMYRVLKPGGKLMCLEFSQPMWLWLRWLYDQYSFKVMPWLGELLVGNRQAYTHLPETIRLFPLPQELKGLLESVGFEDVYYRRLTNGIAVIHIGRRPQSDAHRCKT